MPVLINAVTISAVQLALLWLCGAGLARLLLPERLRQHETTLAPLFGLALVALVGFYGANAGFTMRQLLPVALGAGVALLLLTVLRPHDRRRWPRVLPPAELLPLLLLMLGTWLLNIAPVLHYGTLMPIGHNWDVEFYLPLADYLKDYSYPAFAQIPASPLRTTVSVDPTFSRAMGATYAQAMADALGGWDAWASWVPMLALLRALTLPGLYALLRDGLGVRPWGALAGVALAGVNSLLLWTTYNNFGMGLGGLALLPAALVCMVAALEKWEPRAIVGAALLLGGLTCTYWPMLMAYGAAGFGLGAALLWERRHADWLHVVLRGGLALLGGGLLGMLAHMRAPVTFLGVFTNFAAQTDGGFFISPAVIAGSAPFPIMSVFPGGAPAADAFATALETIGLGAALVLLLLGVWRACWRWRAAGMLACVVGYLAGLRFEIGFPYGFLRGASYTNTLLVGVMGAGLIVGHVRPTRAWLRPVSALLLAALLLSSGWASYRAYAVYAGQPGIWDVNASRLRALAQELQPGAVLVSPQAATQLCGMPLTAWAYALRDHELLGSMHAGYGALTNERPGAAAGYGMLRMGEDPQEYGLAMPPLWQQNDVAIYPASAERSAWLSGRTNFYTQMPHCERDATNIDRDMLGVGDYMAAQPGQPLTMYAAADALGWQPLQSSASGMRSVSLDLLSFSAQTIEIMVGNEHRRVEVPAGQSMYQTGPVVTPLQITMKADAPLMVRWAGLTAARLPDADVNEQNVLLGMTGTATPQGVTTQVQLQNSSAEQLRLAIDVREVVQGYYAAPATYARSLFPLPQNGTHQVKLDMNDLAFTLDGAALPVERGTMKDGSFYASLWLYQGEQVVRVLPFARFERQHGAIMAVEPLNVNMAVARLNAPEHALDAQFGQQIGLVGYSLSATSAAPGEAVQLSLLWQANAPIRQPYLVFAQLLDAQNRKVAQWDGAAGGDWWPTPAWQPGQRVWQDVPLQVAADAPPGRYRLLVGVYDPATGARLPLADGQDALEPGVVEVK
jgi:hypothetical protein